MINALYNDPEKGWRPITVAEARKRYASTVHSDSYLFKCPRCKELLTFVNNRKDGKQQPHFRHKNGSEACPLKIEAEESNGSSSQNESSKNGPYIELRISSINKYIVNFKVIILERLIDSVGDLQTAKHIIFKDPHAKSRNVDVLSNIYNLSCSGNKSELLKEQFDLSFIPSEKLLIDFENGKDTIEVDCLYKDCTVFTDSQLPKKIDNNRNIHLFYGQSYLFWVNRELVSKSIFRLYPESSILSRCGNYLLIRGVISYNSQLVQFLIGHCYPVPVFKDIHDVILWPPFLRIKASSEKKEIQLFCEEHFYDLVAQYNEDYSDLTGYVVRRETSNESKCKSVTEDYFLDLVSRAIFTQFCVEVKDESGNLVMSQIEPVEIPSAKGLYFSPEFDGEIIFLNNNIPIFKKSFCAESNNVSIPNDFIKKGIDVQIMYGKDCVWQISFIQEKVTDNQFDENTSFILKKMMKVLSSDHGSLVKFERRYLNMISDVNFIPKQLKRILSRYYFKGTIPIKALHLLYELNKKRGN